MTEELRTDEHFRSVTVDDEPTAGVVGGEDEAAELCARAPVGLLAELTHRCPLQCPYSSHRVELEGVTSLRLDDEEGRVSIEAANLESFLRDLTRIAAGEHVGVAEVDSPDASLEAVFDYLVE